MYKDDCGVGRAEDDSGTGWLPRGLFEDDIQTQKHGDNVRKTSERTQNLHCVKINQSHYRSILFVINEVLQKDYCVFN
jgi:hypothetical protein